MIFRQHFFFLSLCKKTYVLPAIYTYFFRIALFEIECVPEFLVFLMLLYCLDTLLCLPGWQSWAASLAGHIQCHSLRQLSPNPGRFKNPVLSHHFQHLKQDHLLYCISDLITRESQKILNINSCVSST